MIRSATRRITQTSARWQSSSLVARRDFLQNSSPSHRHVSTGSSASDEFAPPIDALTDFESSPATPGPEAASSAAESASRIAEQAAAFEPSAWPSDQCLLLLNWINETAGLPCYAYTIGATTIAFRVLLFPLFVKAQRNSSRIAHMQPEMTALKNELDKSSGPVDAQRQQRYATEVKALFKKYDCSMLDSLIAPLTSAPIFMSMFFGLKNGAEYFPELFSTGGLWWFEDLTAPDPYMIMPVLSASTFLLMTETGKEQMMASDPARGRIMVNMFRAIAIIMVPVTMDFNSAVFVYWTVNNSWSLGQTLLLRNHSVKKLFGIWEPPKPVPGQEPKGIFDEIKNVMAKNKNASALDEDRIKAHNEYIARKNKAKQHMWKKEGLRGKGRGSI